jgi:hypothetical protein
MNKARVAVQTFKLVVYAALVLARGRLVKGQLTCEGKCGLSYIQTGSSHCHCDYWCNNRDDCCGGTESKNLQCPHLK